MYGLARNEGNGLQLRSCGSRVVGEDVRKDYSSISENDLAMLLRKLLMVSNGA